MNAEFLEKNIVIYLTTGDPDGKQMYTAKKIRKNLSPTSFIGATAITEDGLEAYSISAAKVYSYPNITVIRVTAGPYELPYRPASGAFLSMPLN